MRHSLFEALHLNVLREAPFVEMLLGERLFGGTVLIDRSSSEHAALKRSCFTSCSDETLVVQTSLVERPSSNVLR